jgi:hypothetical protein
MTASNVPSARDEARPLLLQLEPKLGVREVRQELHLHTMTFRPLARPGKDEYPVGRVSTVNVVVDCVDATTHEFALTSASGDSVSQCIPGGLQVVGLRISWHTVYGGELRLACF